MSRKKQYGIPPSDRYGLNRDEAAEYLGVSPNLFDDMVADGRMPEPKRINSRNVWSRRLLEQHFDKLPERGAQVAVLDAHTDPYSSFTA